MPLVYCSWQKLAASFYLPFPFLSACPMSVFPLSATLDCDLGFASFSAYAPHLAWGLTQSLLPVYVCGIDGGMLEPTHAYRLVGAGCVPIFSSPHSGTPHWWHKIGHGGTIRIIEYRHSKVRALFLPPLPPESRLSNI